MSRCDLDVRLLDLERLLYIGCHMIKVFTEFEQKKQCAAELLIICQVCAIGFSSVFAVFFGNAENARLQKRENGKGSTEVHRWKTRDWKMRDWKP